MEFLADIVLVLLYKLNFFFYSVTPFLALTNRIV